MNFGHFLQQSDDPEVTHFQVCKCWRRILGETVHLQYLMKLGADNLVDNLASNDLTSASKLDLLHERKAAWRQLRWKEMGGVSTPGLCNAYEFVSGVFAKAANIDRHPNGWRRLSVYTLPNRLGPGQNRIINDVGMFCQDFAMDPTQDLITFVELIPR